MVVDVLPVLPPIAMTALTAEWECKTRQAMWWCYLPVAGAVARERARLLQRFELGRNK